MDRIEIHFGNEAHTTAWHLVRAFERLVPEVIISGVGHRRADADHDCPLLWVESGRPSLPLPRELHGRISAAWIIDTHRGLEWRGRLARAFGSVLVAQRSAITLLTTSYDVGATWLPLAFPVDSLPPSGPPHADVDFVGHVVPGSRRERIIRPLADRYGFPVGEYVPPSEMVARYARSRLVLNIPFDGDLNMRTFEATGAGAHLVTGPMDGLAALLPSETFTVVESDDSSDWIRALDRLLLGDAGLGVQRERARAAIAERHTYDQRARFIIDVLAATEPSTADPRDLAHAATALGLPRIAASGGGSAPQRAARIRRASAVALRRRIRQARRWLRSTVLP